MSRKTVVSLFASILLLTVSACSNPLLRAEAPAEPPVKSQAAPAAEVAQAPQSPVAVNALKEGQSCCAGGWVQCDCGERPVSQAQVVYVDRPVEQCTQRVRVIEQRETCSDCNAFPVAVREKGACEK